MTGHPFTIHVDPTRYGLDTDLGIYLDVSESPPNKFNPRGGARISMETGSWGLTITLRGKELEDLYNQLGEIISRAADVDHTTKH